MDAVLINAGVTHPLDVWLDALAPGGRLVLPITATAPSMGPIGKGFMVLVTVTRGSQPYAVRMLTFVAGLLRDRLAR